MKTSVMNRSALKPLATVLLSLLLATPGVALADHLHDNSADEISCALCAMSGQDAALKEMGIALPPSDAAPLLLSLYRLPVSTRCLTERQRGPPLLR